MVRFGAVINPSSRRNKKKGAIDRLFSLSKGYDVHFEVAPISQRPSAEVYKRPLGNLANKDVDAFLDISGDGGQHLIDTARFSLGLQRTPHVNLRGGTINARAEGLDLPQRNCYQRIFGPSTTEHLLGLFLERYGKEDPSKLNKKYRTLIRVDTNEGTSYGFAYGSGLVTNFYRLYNERGADHMAAFQVIGELLAAHYLPFLPQNKLDDLFRKEEKKVYLDGNFLGRDPLITLVTSLDIRMDFGPLELSIWPLVGTNERKDFRYISSQDASVEELAQQAGQIFRIKGFEPGDSTINDLVERNASYLRIVPDNKHEYLIDGEIYTTNGPLNVSVSEPIPFLTL